ncbi:MAG: hypothetical protein V3U16_06840 [Candidatus Neomarinimicrobiota bacterium]
MRGKISTILIMIFVAIFVILGCEDTKAEENKPESGQIMGTITFLGDWPEDGQVAVSLNVNWLPTGAPYAFFSITQDDLVNGSYNYDFTDVAFGDYALIVVSWKMPNNDDNTSNQISIGAHSGSLGEYYLDADVISVTQDNNVLVIDFEAAFELIN